MSPTNAQTADKVAPVLPGLPFLGRWYDITYRRLWLLKKVSKIADVAVARSPGREFYLVSHPDGVFRILVENVQNYPKDTRTFRELAKIGGRGIFLSGGEYWRRNRRIIQPSFRRKHMREFDSVIVEATEDLLAQWENASDKRRNVSADMMALTLRIIGLTMFGSDMKDEAHAMCHSVDRLVLLTDEARKPTKRFRKLLPGADRDFQKEITAVDRLLMNTISERRAGPLGKGPPNMIDLLVQAQADDSGERLDDRQVRDEVMNVFVAGNETTATMLTWTLYLLSRNPGAMSRAVADIDSTCGSRPVEAADVPQLPYLEWILRESMRMFPPAWRIARTATKSDSVLGYHIPAGSTVVVSPYTLHRDPRFWEQPDRFWPDRWQAGHEGGPKHKLAFIPFGAGQRLCVGADLTYFEGALILATLLRRVVPVLPQDASVVEKAGALTMQPAGGLELMIQSRESNCLVPS